MPAASPPATPTLAADDFANWYRLLETPGIGRDTARRLLAACGSPAGVLAASADTWRRVAGAAAAAALAKTVTQAPAVLLERLAAAQRWLAGAPDRHVITLDHPAWPPALLQSPDAPLLLYVQGNLALLSAPSVAIVGSRHPTVVGTDNARAFAAALTGHGLVVVSGLARGIDAAAHEGALSGATLSAAALSAAPQAGRAAASTIAVVGTGLDIVYPRSHGKLAQRIAEHGALVSEYAPGTPPLPDHFPQRNRIIAGLSLGTLVVEAALPSGSLITARLASEAGREVFAIPGSIHAPQAKGCHWLIKQGAKLVESAQDILEELRLAPGSQASLPLTAPAADTDAEDSNPLLAALGHDPVTLDALMARTGWPASELAAKLLDLELDGRVARLPGGLYQRRHAA